MKPRSVTAIVACLILFCGCSADAAGGNDSKELHGSWEVASAELEGKPFPDAKEAILVVTRETASFVPARKNVGSPTEKASYVLDAGKTPNEVDFIFEADQKQKVTVRGIYRVEGNTLKLCMEAVWSDKGPPGKGRPKEFATKTDSGHMLLVFKRQK